MAASDDAEQLITYLHEALHLLHTPNRLTSSALCALPLFDHYHQQHPTLTPAHALSNLLTDLAQEMSNEHPKLSDLLRGHFWEGLTVDEMLDQQRPEAQSPRRFHQQQSQAIGYLAQAWQEADLRLQQQRQRQKLLGQLPAANYESLFGAESWIDEAIFVLRDPNEAPILTLKGNGGIGKTALADRVVRHLVEEDESYQQVVWISAKQEYLSVDGIHALGKGPSQISLPQIFEKLIQALGMYQLSGRCMQQQIDGLVPLLRGQPHLIVIDNLESVHDFEQLTPHLARLVNPSRFLLTSRLTMPSSLPIHVIELDELPEKAAFALIEHVAQQKGVKDCDLQLIHRLVGGNPLALILTVSQMKRLPPKVVLESLRQHKADPLYRYIYWNAWHDLNSTARDLLFAIERAGDQADWYWLTMVCDHSLEQIQHAVEALLDYSLVSLRSREKGNRLYGIHRLTSTFLRNEVLGWM